MIFNKNDTIGKYEVLKGLGHGFFGEAYFVKDTLLGRESVIKVFFDGNLNELLKEAKLQVGLKHSNIVKVHSTDLIKDVTIPYASISSLIKNNSRLANHHNVSKAIKEKSNTILNILVIDMEYINNGSLGKYLEDNFISVKESVGYMIKILFALEYMHNKNIVHKDIKPDNILLNLKNEPMLSDFGLSGHLNDLSTLCYNTHKPPENYKGDPISKSIDIFASGMTLYRLVNNFKNWKEIISSKKITDLDIQDGNLIKKIGFEKYIPRNLRMIINKACNPDPDKRYKNISKFKNALSSFAPKTSWIFKENKWQGFCGNDIFEFDVNIKKRLNIFELKVKKNRKSITGYLKKFKDEESLNNEIFNYIKNTY